MFNLISLRFLSINGSSSPVQKLIIQRLNSIQTLPNHLCYQCRHPELYSSDPLKCFCVFGFVSCSLRLFELLKCWLIAQISPILSGGGWGVGGWISILYFFSTLSSFPATSLTISSPFLSFLYLNFPFSHLPLTLSHHHNLSCHDFLVENPMDTSLYLIWPPKGIWISPFDWGIDYSLSPDTLSSLDSQVHFQNLLLCVLFICCSWGSGSEPSA